MFISKDQLAIIIPAYNEQSSIRKVVIGVKEYGVPIVVNDASDDDTSINASEAGAHVVEHEINRGYEASLETGILRAKAMGFHFAITMDADGQHDPKYISVYLDEFEKGADLIVGQRDKTQRFSEKLFCFIGSYIWGIKDPLCGMKGYKLEKLMPISNLRTFESIGTECSFKLVRNGAVVAQPSVIILPRDGSTRFGSGLLVNLRVIKALVNSILKLR